MGHSRLGYLPQSYAWQDLIALIASGGNAAAVADATMAAAREGLDAAAKDRGLRFVAYLLMQVPLAGQAGDLALGLREAGIGVPPDPTVFDIVGGFAEAVDDRLLHDRSRTDFGEMAQAVAAEALAARVGGELGTLYGHDPDDVRLTVKGLASEDGFAGLAHDFFGRFINRFLGYHLSRELSAHVGPGRRFADVAAHAEFVHGLRTTGEQMAYIVRAFAGTWYRKHLRANGGTITPELARDFVHGAFKKLRTELDARGGAHVAA